MDNALRSLVRRLPAQNTVTPRYSCSWPPRSEDRDTSVLSTQYSVLGTRVPGLPTQNTAGRRPRIFGAPIHDAAV
jgi:hypothetical protein